MYAHPKNTLYTSTETLSISKNATNALATEVHSTLTLFPLIFLHLQRKITFLAHFNQHHTLFTSN